MLKDQFKKVGVSIGEGKYHEEIVYGIALVYTSIYNQIAEYLKDYELTPTDMNALMLIKHQGKDKGLAQVEIGERLMVTAHNMTRLLQRLEKKGLIERGSHKKDGRVTMVKIARKGSTLLDQVWSGYDKKVSRTLDGLNEKEQEVFNSLLQKWLGNLRK